MKQTLERLLRLSALDRLPRTGWAVSGIPDAESVAAHSLGTALVVLFLAPREEPALDVDRAVALAVVHDTPEALIGDLPRSASELLGREAKARAEQRAAEHLLEDRAHAAFVEYSAGLSREARFVRLCDRLHLGLQLVRYGREGARSLGEFRSGLEELDCSEFAACAEFQSSLLTALAEQSP